MTNLIGQTLGEYQIVEEIGQGGMALVYKAWQAKLNRYVALKVLPQQFTFDQKFVQRFLNEARTAAGLDHPNIIPIYDADEQQGIYYITMRYVEGETLGQRIQREGALPPARVVRIVEQVAAALDYAHQQGFVHRDVKPSNVLLSEGDHAILTDFGIARAAEGTRLTSMGTLIGTPEYMSPEQAKGMEVDYHSDIYSLGIVAYEMLTGRAAFIASTPHAVLHAHIYEPPSSLRAANPQLSAGVEAAVIKALAKEPGQRYKSAGELAGALVEAGRGKPIAVQEPPMQAARRGVRTAEADLARLFDDGLATYRRGEWAHAKELLAEVVQRRPRYERGRWKANALLAEVERHLALPRRSSGWMWVLGSIVLLLGVGVLLYQAQTTATAWAQATAEAHATATSRAQATADAQESFWKARWWTEEAVRHIEAEKPGQAREILIDTVINWFYEIPQPITAKKQKSFWNARWWTEESVRRIEEGSPEQARQILINIVIPWFYEPRE